MFTGSRDVVVSSNDTVEVIEQAARAFATEYLSRGDPAIEFTKLIGVNVYEVREDITFVLPVAYDSQPKVLYKEAYSMTPEKIENLDLGGGQLMRHKGLTSILVSQDPVSKIKSRNLIAEFSESYSTHLSPKVLSSLKSYRDIANSGSTTRCLNVNPSPLSSLGTGLWILLLSRPCKSFGMPSAPT